MHTFYAVVQANSFVGAAQSLQLTPSVVSKRVAKLEQNLGAKLLQRSTRKLSLTEAGLRLSRHCERILEELQQAEDTVHSLQGEARGQLRITTVHSISQLLLAPMLARFHAQHPQIQLSIQSSDRRVDLVAEGYDLALRVTDKPPPDLVAKALTRVHFGLYGSREYLQQHGEPHNPEALAEHRCMGYAGLLHPQWQFRRQGETFQAPATPIVEINSAEILRQLVLDGLGLARLPNYSVAADLQAGRLRQVLPEYGGFGTATLYALYPANRYGSPKLQTFLNSLKQSLEQLQIAP